MFNIKLINLYTNMFTLANHSAISPIISPASLFIALFTFIVSMLFALIAFNKYENLVLRISSLKISSHITLNNVFIIWIHN